MTTLSPADLARRTPAHRDRYLDFLRALAIAVVVLGHWLMAIVWTEGGALRTASLLSREPATQWLTWLLQVMPVFFIVGGAVNARLWRSAQARGSDYATWLRGRAARLLRPTIPLIWLWVVLAPVLTAAGLDGDLVQLAAQGSLLPMWFLAVYLLVVAAVPPLLALHDRFGLRLVVGLAAAAAVVDALARSGLGGIGLVNFFLVWAAPTALGFCWADGLLEGRGARRTLPIAGAALLILAVTRLGYPVSMVGVPDAAASNNSPPTVALVLLGWLQAGIVLAAREPVARWLGRPRPRGRGVSRHARSPWAAVVTLNLFAMTVYLWHLTVMVLLVGALHAAGWWLSTPPLSAAWWAGRPPWLGLLAAALVPVVALLARVELISPVPGRGHAAIAVLAVAIASAAIGVLVLHGASLLLAATVTVAALSLGAFPARPYAEARERA